MTVAISHLAPADLLELEPQASQRRTLGVDTRSVAADEAEDLAGDVEAWAVRSHGRLIACFGIRDLFAGRHGGVWAILGEGIGAAHLAMTRFARSRVAACGLARVDAIVRAPCAESVIASFPFVASDPEALLVALSAMPTPEMTWARLCGLTPVHVLRKYGADGGTHILCERIA